MNDADDVVGRARRGDAGAFEQIVMENQARIFRICYGMLGNTADADEAAQDVFVKLFGSIKSFRGDSRLSTWLYRVAVNTCTDRLRNRTWRRWLGLDAAETHSERRDRPDVQAEQREDVARLRRTMDGMSTKLREVLVLRELESREYAEIAEILGISIGTVESRLFRAREMLRRRLDDDPETATEVKDA